VGTRCCVPHEADRSSAVLVQNGVAPTGAGASTIAGTPAPVDALGIVAGAGGKSPTRNGFVARKYGAGVLRPMINADLSGGAEAGPIDRVPGAVRQIEIVMIGDVEEVVGETGASNERVQRHAHNGRLAPIATRDAARQVGIGREVEEVTA